MTVLSPSAYYSYAVSHEGDVFWFADCRLATLCNTPVGDYLNWLKLCVVP